MNEKNKQISLNDTITKWLSNHIIGVFLIFVAFLIVFPLLVTQCSIIGFSSEANEIGDAIGGTTAPIIGTFSALLVYLAFKSQLEANDKLINMNKSQLSIQEFSLFSTKLEFIKKNYDTNFLFLMRNDTIEKFKIDVRNRQKSLENAKNYLEIFIGNYTDKKQAIQLLEIFGTQLKKSGLKKSEKDFLSLELIKLIDIKQNSHNYRFNESIKPDLKHYCQNNFKNYNDIIDYIEKLEI